MKRPRRISWIVTPPITFLILLIQTGCDTQPPLIPVVSPVEFGRLYVAANVGNARIFIDNSDTGKLTPDTIEATAGPHLVRVEKGGFTPVSQSVYIMRDSLTQISVILEVAAGLRVVLIEDFSNVSCMPCVASNLVLKALVGGSYDRARLIAIKYATNFPSPSDPFYLAAQPFCDSRMSYYHILFAPTLIVDGTRRPTATDSSGIKDSINASLVRNAQFSLSVTQSISGDLLSIQVRVVALDTTGIDFRNLVLHTVLLEDEITYASPPGANGETVFRDVMRVMLPSAEGEQIVSLAPGSSVFYQRQTPIASTWNASLLRSVAFVQNKHTKTVYQAGSTQE